MSDDKKVKLLEKSVNRGCSILGIILLDWYLTETLKNNDIILKYAILSGVSS